MKITKTILLAFCFAGFSVAEVKAQQGQSASSGEAYGSGGTASFTIGQADYVVTNGIGGTISQGVQQPIEIYVLSGVEQQEIQLKCAVYPNPAVDYVTLSIETPLSDKMTCLLYNTQGQVLSYQKLSNNDTKISMTDFSNSIYYLKVLNNNKEVKTFKIIKNK